MMNHLSQFGFLSNQTLPYCLHRCGCRILQDLTEIPLMLRLFQSGSHQLKQLHLDLHPNHLHQCQVKHLNDSGDLIQSVLPSHLAYRLQRMGTVSE